MPTWRLEIEYEGTRYRGWQIQHNAKSVQGELQDAARQLFSGKFEIFGAGRTDAGVHALRQVAHLKVAELTANLAPRQIQFVKVETAEIFADGDLICFRIGASHFLWKMVRRIVGMLVEVGRGDLTYDGFERLLKFQSDVPAKFTAPPSGLFLEKVLYGGDTPPTGRQSVSLVR
jgi:tRNA U38,U39,U40 pseudouridine synthase TruA